MKKNIRIRNVYDSLPRSLRSVFLRRTICGVLLILMSPVSFMTDVTGLFSVLSASGAVMILSAFAMLYKFSRNGIFVFEGTCSGREKTVAGRIKRIYISDGGKTIAIAPDRGLPEIEEGDNVRVYIPSGSAVSVIGGTAHVSSYYSAEITERRECLHSQEEKNLSRNR